jgi:hypothetical protein
MTACFPNPAAAKPYGALDNSTKQNDLFDRGHAVPAPASAALTFGAAGSPRLPRTADRSAAPSAGGYVQPTESR